MSKFEWSDKSSGKISANGKNLEYICHGAAPDTAPTIVILHEGLGCLELWRKFPEDLAKATGCGVFVYSRAGYGRSDLAELPRPLDYMTREAMDVLPEILDMIGSKHVILLGHSDGATIAAIYGGSIEDHRVRALVLMAPHFFTEPEGLAEIAKAKTVYDDDGLKERMAKYHNDPDHTFRGWNDAWLHPDFKNWNVAEVIDYLRIPVLAIQGKADQYGSFAQIKEIDDRIYSPLDIVMLDDCRHSPLIDQPENTLNAVAEFVSRLNRIESEEVKVA